MDFISSYYLNSFFISSNCFILSVYNFSKSFFCDSNKLTSASRSFTIFSSIYNRECFWCSLIFTFSSLIFSCFLMTSFLIFLTERSSSYWILEKFLFYIFAFYNWSFISFNLQITILNYYHISAFQWIIYIIQMSFLCFDDWNNCFKIFLLFC